MTDNSKKLLRELKSYEKSLNGNHKAAEMLIMLSCSTNAVKVFGSEDNALERIIVLLKDCKTFEECIEKFLIEIGIDLSDDDEDDYDEEEEEIVE